MATLGEVAYVAYRNGLGWRHEDGSVVADFTQLPENEQKAWNDVADKVLEEAKPAHKEGEQMVSTLGGASENIPNPMLPQDMSHMHEEQHDEPPARAKTAGARSSERK